MRRRAYIHVAQLCNGKISVMHQFFDAYTEAEAQAKADEFAAEMVGCADTNMLRDHYTDGDFMVDYIFPIEGKDADEFVIPQHEVADRG